MKKIFAVDPGPKQSGWVLYQAGTVLASGVDDNQVVRENIEQANPDELVVEQIRSYGMAVGADVFDTCVWTGRLVEFWETLCMRKQTYKPEAFLMPRKHVVLHLCNSPRGKDSNVRQALIDKLGAPGTRKNPGPTFGVSSHAWSALAIAVTHVEAPYAET